MIDLLIIRTLFVAVLACAAFFLHPFNLDGPVAAAVGAVVGAGVVLFEFRIRQVSLKRLIGAAFGSVLGILGAYLISLVLEHAVPDNKTTIPFVEVALLAWMTYCGLVVGAAKGDMLNLAALGGLFGGEAGSKHSFKILDTSVIIDGRIADIVETGFVDGALVIPQFVLRELQLVADSSDSMKRNRGRRGLDVLQRIQKMPQLNMQIVEDDFPNVREVDMKLIELAKVYDCKIVTNDFNLNKVAQLHGVEVLNINELANALKPVVLPGRADARLHSEGRQGIQPGRRVSGRRHHGGGGQRAQDDLEDHRYRRDQRAADHGGQDDFRALRRSRACGARRAAPCRGGERQRRRR